ncbi:MAG: hypothetical protein EB015_21665, partial [Methylocystaceae bacterium]|nr:hypothetical protein [Methylocystaceae bacterium]
YPFKTSIFLKKVYWNNPQVYYYNDIHILRLNSSTFKDILGKTFELPPYNVVYKKKNGNYIFLLNDNFEEFNIPLENINDTYKYHSHLVIRNRNIKMIDRPFLAAGGNRTKRNRKNRKGTRRLKRRQ